MPKLTPTLILHQGPGSSLSSGIFENHPLDVWAAATLRNPSGCQVSWEDGPGSVCIGVQRALPPDVLLSRHCGKVRLTTGFLQLAFDYAGGKAGDQHAHLVFTEDPCLASTHLPLLGGTLYVQPKSWLNLNCRSCPCPGLPWDRDLISRQSHRVGSRSAQKSCTVPPLLCNTFGPKHPPPLHPPHSSLLTDITRFLMSRA